MSRADDHEAAEAGAAIGGNPLCPANTSELLDLAEDAADGDAEAAALLERLRWRFGQHDDDTNKETRHG